MRRSIFGLLLAFLVQAGLLGWTVGERALILVNGTEIRLQVVPVDPRDLLRGDFVMLSYAISRVDSDRVAGDDAFGAGDTIYVTIAKDADGAWQATAISHTKPGTGMFLEGTIDQINARLPRDCTGGETCLTYTIAYNLERFFVPEGTGRELQTLRNDQRMAVDVAVADDGRAAAKRLLVDGEVRYEEGWW